MADSSTPSRSVRKRHERPSADNELTPKRMRRELVFHRVSPSVLRARMVKKKYSPLSSTTRNLLLTRLAATEGLFLKFKGREYKIGSLQFAN